MMVPSQIFLSILFENINMIRFGERLREMRKEKGLTEQQFADEFFVSSRTIRYWEAGSKECDFQTLVNIADFFNTTTDYLLGRTDFEE